jgi:homospermidine synthase
MPPPFRYLLSAAVSILVLKKKKKNNNLKVAAGMASAIMWMIKNPNMGICTPGKLAMKKKKDNQREEKKP